MAAREAASEAAGDEGVRACSSSSLDVGAAAERSGALSESVAADGMASSVCAARRRAVRSSAGEYGSGRLALSLPLLLSIFMAM